ncbi:MAG: hypothetical protein EON61_05545 [Alphaproteobacteria bacterium]|nr:MAG: hypothetical protein EON61_05545 [Alphaproteobacteria bacterium]
MVQSDGRNLKKDGKDGKGGRPRTSGQGKLKLVRVEPAGKKGITLIFSQDGHEHGWLLEHTSVTEFLALLLRGRIQRGRRVELEQAELTIDPPPSGSDHPQLCMSLGPLEVCTPLNRSTVKALQADLERVSRKPG